MALRFASCPGANSPRTSCWHAGIAARAVGEQRLRRRAVAAAPRAVGRRRQGDRRHHDHALARVAGREPLARRARSRPVSAASAASIRSCEPSSSVRTPWARSTAVAPGALAHALRGRAPPPSTTALAWGNTSMALPFGLPARVRGEPCLRRLREDLEPHLHPVEERVPLPCVGARGVERLDVERRELALGAPGPSGRRPARRGVDRDHVGAQLVRSPLRRRARAHGNDTCSGTSRSSSRTRSSPLSTPDVDAQRPHAVATGWALPAVGQEVQQVAARQHAEHLAGLRDEHGRAVLQLGERRLDRVVPLHHGDRRRHHLGDVGLQGVGVAEHPLQQLAVADRAHERDDVGDPRRAPPAPGRCRAPCSTSTAWRTFVVGVDRDQRAASRRPWRPAPLRRVIASGRSSIRTGSIQDVGVDLRQVVAAGVGQQDHDRRVGVEFAGDLRAPRTPRMPHDPPTRMPSCRVTARAVRKASRSATLTQRSTTAGSNVPGQKSSPMPFHQVRAWLVAGVDRALRCRRRRS